MESHLKLYSRQFQENEFDKFRQSAERTKLIPQDIYKKEPKITIICSSTILLLNGLLTIKAP